MKLWDPARRLPGRIVIGLVRLYQWTLSPWLGKNCRFYPSCSAYMIQAIEKYGVEEGISYISTGGYDPP